MTLAVTQLYSNYDFAVANLVHLLTYPPTPGEERPVLHVFATPERAFAQVEIKLKNRPDDAQRVFPLPFVSIDRLSTPFDPTRASRAQLKKMFYTSAERTRYFGMDWPIPVTLPYQISMWTKQIRDINHLLVQWMSLFDHTPARYLTVKHPFPMGTRSVFSKVTEITPVPMIPSAEKQRIVRQVVTLVVDGWIVREPTDYGIVEKVITDFYDSPDLEEDGTCLERLTVTDEEATVSSCPG